MKSFKSGNVIMCVRREDYTKRNLFVTNYAFLVYIVQKEGDNLLDMDTVFREHAKFVCKYIYSLCHEEETAKELLQETFCQAIRCSRNYDGTCKVTTWLCQIAKHLWYKELERRKKHHITELSENDVFSGVDMEEHVCQKEQLIEIFQKVHILDELSKEVFYLRVMGDFSFREIGRILEKSENWARVTFYRAKQKIMEGRE